MGIGFTLKGKLLVKYDDHFIETPALGLRDIYTQGTYVKTEGDFLNISVRFTQGSAHYFCNTHMKEVIDEKILALENIFSATDLSVLTDKLINAQNDTDIISCLDGFLLNRFAPKNIDKVYYALSLINNAKGTCRVSDLAVKLNHSERTIHRLFNHYIGINPIEYINLIRFRALIDDLKNTEVSSFLNKALHAGYYDQSHFIKEFKKYVLITPNQFRKDTDQKLVSDFYNI